MRTIPISEAKDQLSALLRAVEAGETILIVNRSRPVARLEPCRGAEWHPGERLARLERLGVIRRASCPPDARLLDPPLPSAPGGASLLQAVLEERGDGR